MEVDLAKYCILIPEILTWSLGKVFAESMVSTPVVDEGEAVVKKHLSADCWSFSGAWKWVSGLFLPSAWPVSHCGGSLNVPICHSILNSKPVLI